MSAQTLLSGGDKWYSYSGEISGDVSAPTSITMILIPNTGLRDSYIELYPFYGDLISGTSANALGIQVKLNDTVILRSKQYYGGNQAIQQDSELVNLFIPRQSKLEVISLNTSGNNTQIRGVNLIGYYL